MYLILLTLMSFNIQWINTANPFLPSDDFNFTLGHLWDPREDTVTIYFDISNASFQEYRYYFFDLRPFASHDHPEYFIKQRLDDTHNSLKIHGLHENDYVSCVSFIDEYENLIQPRYACYEFTLGEKTIGSHHAASSGYLAPLLLAFAFVIHVFIAVVHHIKSKNYAQKLLDRFINVNPKVTKRTLSVRHSLKQLDHPHHSTSVQRRLSRVSIADDEPVGSFVSMQKTNDEPPIYVLPHHRKASVGVMQTILEHHP